MACALVNHIDRGTPRGRDHQSASLAGVYACARVSDAGRAEVSRNTTECRMHCVPPWKIQRGEGAGGFNGIHKRHSRRGDLQTRGLNRRSSSSAKRDALLPPVHGCNMRRQRTCAKRFHGILAPEHYNLYNGT